MTLSLHRRSLFRWCAGGLIAFVSLVQALRALGSLPGGVWSLGGLAIGALAALTVAGMAGLLGARLRIERELLAMRHEPPGGALVGARRERLQRIAMLGARPDADALAEAAATSERGRAYLGRWLVAVAVLIGLVGTFSGLAEALRGLPAIFDGAAGDPQRLAELMRGATAGLQLTFTAGVVGILSTLALALVQGDLQLHEEQALARLEELTAHELVPALWPATERADERAARELAGLRQDASAVRALVAESGTAIGAAVAAELGRAVGELRAQQAESLRAITEQLAATTTQLSTRLEALHEAHARTAADGWRAVTDALVPSMDEARAALDAGVLSAVSTLEGAVAEVARGLSTAAEAQAHAAAEVTRGLSAATEAQAHAAAEVTRGLSAAGEQQRATAADGWRAVADALVPSLAEARAALDASVAGATAALDTSVAIAVTSLEQTAATITLRLGEATAAQSAAAEVALAGLADASLGALAGPSAQLADAAASLAQSQQALAPQLEALAPELRALTQEVALLGTRADKEDEPPLFADELVRLGEGMSRLEALVQLSQQGKRPGARG